ncbi:MAG: winged helix-turn-helix domain-containing protein [Candidatus Thiodiazotropha sp. (ex Lucinoma borealis)]|nr:winged helix-turn-helix domain-containing protein [Candidatus Thiodiazotropha sp. (ex Lucinoma borealis)]
MVLSFGDFELDTERYELRRKGQLRKTEPKVFDLILLFCRHPGQIFSREDLINSIWDGRFVSDSTISTCIKSARKALGDSGDAQRYINAVRGRGFRLAVEVVEQVTVNDELSTGVTVDTASDVSTEPSLLILPFQSISASQDAVELAQGLTYDIATILVRIPLLHLSAQTGRYADRGITPSARDIHEDLGVDYILDANVQERGGRFIINVQLADAKSGFHLWAEQFSAVGSISEMLTYSVIAIIAKLEPQLYRAIYHSTRSGEGDPNARELFLEASSMLALKGWHHQSFTIAAGQLRRSWKLDDGFALAPSYLSLVLGFGKRVGLTCDDEQTEAEALEAAERSLELDSMDSSVLGFSGCALADIGYLDRALPILKNAIEINPANAQAWAALGSAYLVQQQMDEAVRHLSHGISISPLDSRLSIWGALLTLAHMLSGDLDEALQQGLLACQRDDRTYMPRVVLAGVHLLRNEVGGAVRMLNDAYRIKPDLSLVQITSLLGKKLGISLLESRQAKP